MRRVFSRPAYLALAAALALFVFVGIALAPNAGLIFEAASDPSTSLREILSLVGSLAVSPFTDLDPLGLFYALALAALSAIDIALLVFYFKMYRAAPSSVNIATNIIGVFSAFLGFGCAACGSVFLTALFASVGGVGFLAALPFHGLEFGFAALILLAFSSFSLTRAINKPVVCPI